MRRTPSTFLVTCFFATLIFTFPADTYGQRNHRLEADISEGSSSSSPANIIIHQGRLYFVAGSENYGTELWTWDGSTARMTEDLWEGTNGGFRARGPRMLASYDGKVYGYAFGGVDKGGGLWSWDGLGFTLETEAAPESNGGKPNYLSVYEGRLYFSKNSPHVPPDPSELWSWDGDSLRLVLDDFARIEHLTVFNDRLYFRGDRADGNGIELWSWDGEEAWLEADLYPGADGSAPSFLTTYNGKLLFAAKGDEETGYELWSWDGRSVSLVADIFEGEPSANPAYLIRHKKKLYMIAKGDETSGRQIWSWNGKRVCQETSVDHSGGSYGISQLTSYGKRIYYAGGTDTEIGAELWSFKPRIINCKCRKP